MSAPRRVRSKAHVAPQAFAAQLGAAGPRERVLFDLQRARVAVNAAIQGLGPGAAARPIAPGKWTPHEIVLHLVARDEARLAELEPMRRGTPASWSGQPAERWSAINEAAIAPRRALPWDAAVRLLHATRERLVEALLALPAEPDGIWSAEHPLGATLAALVVHDRHHAEQIKDARISS